MIAVVTARMGSRRLPRKALLDIAGKPSLCWTICRVQASGFPTFLATPEDEENDPLEDLALGMGVTVFRRPRHAAREIYAVCEAMNADHVIRVTGDDIFVDPDLMRRAAELHIGQGADYTTMPAVSRGWDSEVISRRALGMACNFAEPEMLGIIMAHLDIRHFLTALSTPFKPPMELNTEDDLERIREYASAHSEALSV